MQTSLYKIFGLHGVVFSGKYDAMQILYGVGLHGVGLHGVGLHVRVVPRSDFRSRCNGNER